VAMAMNRKRNCESFALLTNKLTKMKERYINMYTFVDLFSAISLEFTDCRDAMNSSGHLLQYCTDVTGER